MNNYDLLFPHEKEKIDIQTFIERIENNHIVVLKGRKRSVCVGEELSLKVNSAIGANDFSNYSREMQKVSIIATHNNTPDMMMDLSTVPLKTPLYTKIISELGCPVGVIPYYTCFHPDTGIDKQELLYTIEKQAEIGVSFMTLHFTARYDLVKLSAGRNIPVISRGGNILIRDMIINHRTQNILFEIFDEIIDVCKRHDIVISVGATFRPSSQFDAMDTLHIAEIELQHRIINTLKEKGIRVLQEGVGHIPLHEIDNYVGLLRKDTYTPFMPLGPIVSDRTQGLDHICSSIGASYMALLGGADIINAVTRNEHTGGIPPISSIIEAIDAARTVVKIIDDSRYFSFFNKKSVDRISNCIGVANQAGCDRCGEECPFILNEKIKSYAN